jgi:hypothetical protein
LIYQIDFHCGVRRLDAEELFNKVYFQILEGLRCGKYQNNTAFRNEHIIKVICGFGHHNNPKKPESRGKLKRIFLDYFTSNLFDFAYAEDLGTFLLRVKY